MHNDARARVGRDMASTLRDWYDQLVCTIMVPFHVMDHLMNRRRTVLFFPIVAAVTILSGAALYWRHSAGLQPAWISTPSGLAFTIGALAAIASSSGLALVGRAWPNRRQSGTIGGLDPLILWVLAGNVRGRLFYDAMGWRADGSSRPIDFGGTPVEEVRYRSP